MKFITNKKWDALEGQLKAMQSSNVSDLINRFSMRIFASYSVVREMDAYQTMDQVYCVVKKLATCSALIPFYGYDKKGEDLPENDNLVTFLNTLDFEEKEKLYTYLYLNGEVFALKNRTELGSNSNMVGSLTYLHPSRVSLSISNDFPRQVIGYNYFEVETGNNIPIDLDDMIFIKSFNPSANTMDEFRGLSPVKVLARTLTRIKAGEDVTVAQLQNGGGKDIVYDKTPSLDVTIIGQRKDNYSRFARNTDNAGAPYFSVGEMGVIHLGSTLTDMEVTALAGIDFDRICNAFGISSILFNEKSAATESNVENMLAEAYTNTIIPTVLKVEGGLNKGLVLNTSTPEIKTKGVIKCDTSDIKALQEDQVEQTTALAAAWWLTPNEKRAAQMYDQSDDELMDKILIPSNLVPIEDLVMPDPLENTANDYQPGRANVVPLKTGTNG